MLLFFSGAADAQMGSEQMGSEQISTLRETQKYSSAVDTQPLNWGHEQIVRPRRESSPTPQFRQPRSGRRGF